MSSVSDLLSLLLTAGASVTEDADLTNDRLGHVTSTRTSSGFFLLLTDSIFENFLQALLAEKSSYRYKSL